MQNLFIDERYEVKELLGSGGMGEVYLARDEVLNREVALKALHRQYANDEGFVERFKREAQSAGALSHPNIVSVYDRGRSEDGSYYMAMEYVPGGTLKDRILKDAPMPVPEVAGIVSQVAGALGAAHEKGVIHRDIKPQNVLLTDAGLVKVVDFGIARAASATVATRTSLVLGTVSYMSPEQAMGEQVGPASDLYSLGIVVYEMLTGELPFSAETPVAVAMKHVNEPPPSPKETRPDVPEGVDAVVVKLLSKDPDDRYSSAAELAEDLARVRDGLLPLAAGQKDAAPTNVLFPPMPGGPDDEARSIAGRPAGVPVLREDVGRLRRRRPLLAAALLVPLLLLGGLTWALSDSSLGQDGSEVVSGGAAEEAAQTVKEEVPDVKGMLSEEAEEQLADLGFETKAQAQESSKEDKGKVLDQSVAPGESAEKGSMIVPDVGDGPETVEVPDLAGQTVSNAESSLTEVGLKVGDMSEEPSDTIPEGQIIEQSISTGDTAEKR